MIIMQCVFVISEEKETLSISMLCRSSPFYTNSPNSSPSSQFPHIILAGIIDMLYYYLLESRTKNQQHLELFRNMNQEQ